MSSTGTLPDWHYLSQGEIGNEFLYGRGITAFLGVISFEIGAGLAFLEAINDGCFHGSAMRRLLEGHDTDTRKWSTRET